MTLATTELTELLTHHGFEQLPRAGESLVLRHPREGLTFTLCAPPNAGVGRELLVRILVDLRLIDTDSVMRLDKTAGEGSALDPLNDQLARVEVHLVQAALERHGNVSKAAAALGLSRPSLYDKMKRFGLASPRASRATGQERRAGKDPGTGMQGATARPAG